MYAETFKVRAWLEEPAKWLQWAFCGIQSNPRKLAEAEYNLRKFWEALGSAKGQARSPQEWGEVMTLDAQSQLALGWLYQAQQLEQLTKVSAYQASQRYAAKLAALPVLGMGMMFASKNADKVANWLVNQVNPIARSMGEKVAELGRRAAAAFAASKKLASQAEAAYRQAKVKPAEQQASNTLVVAGNASRQAVDVNKAADRTRDKLTQDMNPADAFSKSLKDALNFTVWGLPVWGWGLMAVGLVLALPKPAPVVALRSRA